MEDDSNKEFPVIVAANKEQLADQLTKMEPRPEEYIVHIPDGTTEVADEAFDTTWDDDEEPLGVVGFIIPDTVTRIGNRAFAGCENVQEIILPESVAHIGERAFAGCVQMYRLALPTTLETIGKDIFRGCKCLTKIKLPKVVASKVTHFSGNWATFNFPLGLDKSSGLSEMVREGKSEETYDTPSATPEDLQRYADILDTNKIVLANYAGRYLGGNKGCHMNSPIVIDEVEDYVEIEYAIAEGLLGVWTGRQCRFRLLSQHLLRHGDRKIDCLTYRVESPSGDTAEERYYFDITAGFEANMD